MTQHPGQRAGHRFAAMFERKAADGVAVAFCLPGGKTLFEVGESADAIYLLRSGRLAARLGDPTTPDRLGLIHPGDPVGEMALVEGALHTVEVFALRDSEILAMARSDFFEVVLAEPNLLIELARLMLIRVRQAYRAPPAIANKVFGFIAAAAGAPTRSLAESVGESLRRMGHTVAVLASDTGPAGPEHFSRIEAENDFVLYVVEHDEGIWRALASRQVDRVFRIASGDEKPPRQPISDPGDSDLILLQQPDRLTPVGSADWTHALDPARLFHMRRGRQDDIDRLARIISGRSVGLVLSGGAARAYAHIGVLRALAETDTPVDFIGGVSMGAVIGAGAAMGWSLEELDRRIRKAFVHSNPLGDVAWPLISMSRGERVHARLSEHFGERTICDLWLPFFCGSTNLTTGDYEVHRRGLVRDALRASLSLPGVLPPVVSGPNLLVDGAVLNNFPADVMHTLHGGPIIGADVGTGRSIEAADLVGPLSVWRWLKSGAWRGGPPIISLLMRAATVTAYHEVAATHALADILVLPNVDNIEMADWKAYDPAVTEGRRAMLSALARVEGLVVDMRRVSATTT